jgi:hypothetical protein
MNFQNRVGGINCPLSKVVSFQTISMLFKKILFTVYVHHDTDLYLFSSNLSPRSFTTARHLFSNDIHAARTSCCGIPSQILVKLVLNLTKVYF